MTLNVVKGVILEYCNVKKFIDQSDERWGSLKANIRADRAFISGEQYEDLDEKILGKYRFKEALNIIDNSINSIANNYSKFPFSWYTENAEVNSAIDSFLNSNGNENATTDALYNSVAFGLGVLCLSTDYNQFNEQVEPILYSINDLEKVYLDPSISTLNGQDATKAAIIEVKSKHWIRENYGEEFVEEESHTIYSKESDTFGFSYNHKIEQPIVTYYEKSDGVVKVYTFINGKQIDEPVILRTNFIPVIPVFGENTWEKGKASYKGIVRKTKSIQKLLNYCYCQLCERLSISPKNVYMATREQVQGVEQYWKDSARNLNPLLVYNGYNKKGETLAPPVKVDNRVQFDDLSGIMATVLDMLTSITGVHSTGLADDNKTATASLIESEAYSNNISHYYNHLRQSFKLAGIIFTQVLSLGVNTLEVIKGVAEMNQNVQARQVLSSLLQVMPDKANLIVNGILSTYPDNIVIQNTLVALNQAGKTPREIELEKALEETTKQLEEATDQKKAFEQQLAMEQMKIESNVAMHHEDNQLRALIEDKKADTEIQKEMMKIQADTDKDIRKVFVETTKEVEGL